MTRHARSSRFWFVILALILVAAAIPMWSVAAETEHFAEVERWRNERMQSLKKPDGWLSFIGSGAVATGRSRVGSAADSDIVLATGPAHLGDLTLGDDGELHFEAAADGDARVDGERFERIALRTNLDQGGATRIHVGPAWFYVVRLADGSTGWRLRDPAAPALLRFRGIDNYSIDSTWRIRARWQPLIPAQAIQIVTSAGTLDTAQVPGVAHFERDGRPFELRPIGEDDGRLFFVFADRTSGRDSYGAARFLYADAPADGEVVLDFNKAYNPPCAFTPHVVCPLAPPENRLRLAVTAGEKKPPADLHEP